VGVTIEEMPPLSYLRPDMGINSQDIQPDRNQLCLANGKRIQVRT